MLLVTNIACEALHLGTGKVSNLRYPFAPRIFSYHDESVLIFRMCEVEPDCCSLALAFTCCYNLGIAFGNA